MREHALCVILLAMMLPGPVLGQEAVPLPLRWADVMRRVDALPRVQEVLLRSRAAQAGLDAAGQVPNPEVEARLGWGMPRGSGTSGLEWGVALTIPFDWIGPRGAEMRAARWEADASRLDTITARREVLGRLMRLFWEIAHDQQLVQTLRETEAQVERLAGLIRLRVEKGESRPTELPRIETELERVRLDLERALADLRADRAALEAVLGLSEGAIQAVEADGAAFPEPLSREETIARVAGVHPRLAAALARVRAREAVVAAERARRIPGFSLGGHFDRELDKGAAGGVLQVRLPVWNWNTGAIRRAEAEHAAEERAAESAARDLLAEAGRAWERCVQIRGAAQRFDEEILPRVEAASRAVERGFELGEVSLIDVLDARRVLLDARKERIEAGLRARVECAALAVLTGEIDDAN
ncbi:MAG TPA: TolC family protein [Myxococcota bacterium]|nr:TolC family protein [Myxococcota bacterium]HQK50641.1 TolC family protein [Myxococcota bacterium]